jgi:hypothetical protein
VTGAELRRCFVDGELVETVVAVPYLAGMDLQEIFHRLDPVSPEHWMAERRHLFLDMSLDVSSALGHQGLLPCKSLWNGQGQRLAAILIL